MFIFRHLTLDKSQGLLHSVDCEELERCNFLNSDEYTDYQEFSVFNHRLIVKP